MKKTMKTLTALALCLCLLCGVLASPALAALPDSTRLEQLIDGAVGYGKGAQSDLVNTESLGTLADLDWWVFGAARAGAQADYRTYLAAISTFLEENDSQSVTDVERMFLAVKAAGGDPAAIGGRNLLKELEQADMSTVNAAVFGLLCLGSVDYTPSADALNTVQSLIASLRTLQAADGSFGFSYDGVTYVDAGLTAQVVTALAPYYAADSTAKDIADKALAYLSGIQQADGSFTSWGAVDSTAVAETVVALCALGKDPSAEAAFQKMSGGLVDAMLALCDASGAYDINAYNVKMSTRTGLMAFAALKEHSASAAGNRSLYNLRNVQPLQANMTLEELRSALAAVEAAPTLDNKVTVSSLLLELSLIPAADAEKTDLQTRLNAVKAKILTAKQTVQKLDEDIWNQIDPMNVTLKEKDTVAALMARYNALPDADKAYVENRQDLLDAAAKIAELEAAQAPATGGRSAAALYAALALLGLCGAAILHQKKF